MGDRPSYGRRGPVLGTVLSFLAFAPSLPGTLVLDAAVAWMGVALLGVRAAPAGRPAWAG